MTMITPPCTSPTVHQSAQDIALQALACHRGQQGSLLPILHHIQDRLGYIPEESLPTLAQGLSLSRAEIHGVVSFYPHFRQQAPAPKVLEICRAEACQALGGDALAAHAMRRLNCDFHATSSDGQVALEPVYCLGLCAQSPALMLDGEPHARMSPQKLDQLLTLAKGSQ